MARAHVEAITAAFERARLDAPIHNAHFTKENNHIPLALCVLVQSAHYASAS